MLAFFDACTHYPGTTFIHRLLLFSVLTMFITCFFVFFTPLCLSDFLVSSCSPRILLCFGEISAGNCESFTCCSHNGLWDYAKRGAQAALHIDRHQRCPLERTGRRWRTLNEDVTAITQARLIDTLCVCSLVSHKPRSPLFSSRLKSSLISQCVPILNLHENTIQMLLLPS